MTAVQEAAGPPVRAGRFQLGHELARGGMGVIYSARDDSLGRDVAVKVLHERYQVDSLVGQRFLDEARITAQLQHPGIPPVHDLGELPDPQPELREENLRGCRWISGEPTPLRRGIFCCKPTRPGSSWCPEHYRIAFGRAARRRIDGMSFSRSRRRWKIV